MRRNNAKTMQDMVEKYNGGEASKRIKGRLLGKPEAYRTVLRQSRGRASVGRRNLPHIRRRSRGFGLEGTTTLRALSPRPFPK
jgi:hypothetical protein